MLNDFLNYKVHGKLKLLEKIVKQDPHVDAYMGMGFDISQDGFSIDYLFLGEDYFILGKKYEQTGHSTAKRSSMRAKEKSLQKARQYFSEQPELKRYKCYTKIYIFKGKELEIVDVELS